ncbi:uncharacterized protein LACBIDRAFT_321389 [Laccaria bicolor S238N-H82]|uniref:non-specific serine/threonine protein kinase n=1 Tax=Laccaria bicolor (strain S238N-H82 / ATCC MYA-4686) TaxID=486041 RepID=B0CQ09_LACBS|nr:uncharacterized protein LACBIDRAFT_321389 [Laccaria bicolor S238N-H82]EDR16157.1 predicted protein [Laccaria bicolor S238N-H82]|eukprot:XP_001874365.1 predicted protein [Laccaria bicolor S238N-H82]
MADVPALYRPGSTLNITTSKLYHLTVVVEKVFTPFTTSQVLVVRILSPLPSHPFLLNSLAILKIYDPRYLEEREATYSSDDGSLLQAEHPWTLEKEIAVTEHRKVHPDCHRDWHCDCVDYEVNVELNMYGRAIDSWTREVDAYHILAGSSLSGSTVPIFYDSGDLILDETRAIIARVILLEYIPDVTSVSGLGDIRTIAPRHVSTLIAAAVKLNELGVVHRDINRGNILVGPKRAVIIDFGESISQIQGGIKKFSDDDWWFQVDGSKDPIAVERMVTKPDPTTASRLADADGFQSKRETTCRLSNGYLIAQALIV